MRKLLVLLALPAALAAGAVQAPVAIAAQTQVVADCNSHGRLTRQYSVPALRSALSTMPADVKEYTDCYDVIQRALLAQLAGSSHGGGGGSDQGSGGSFLPTPLIVVLALLALGALSFGVIAARRRAGAPGGR